MTDRSDAENQLEQLEIEFCRIQAGLSFPLNFADLEKLILRFNAILDEARTLCHRSNIPGPDWTQTEKKLSLW